MQKLKLGQFENVKIIKSNAKRIKIINNTYKIIDRFSLNIKSVKL